MRIIQLIDSLETGGAERMAINYANSLSEQISFSGLVATRAEGGLLEQLEEKVGYLFLKRKYTLDLPALFRLRQFVKNNKVTIVHAHSSSFFFAFLLKLSLPSLQLIWHDHYGNSEFLKNRPSFILRLLLPYFKGVIAVNEKLRVWSQQKLKVKNSIYLPNFYSNSFTAKNQTILKGKEGKRIVCLANLRNQKNHELLLEVAKMLKSSHPEWSFHLIGKDWNDFYSANIKMKINEYNLFQTVFLYGAKQDIGTILEQATIGILTSQSEGLPVALLEYGKYKKPVVVTAVGEISQVVQDTQNGFLVPSGETFLFYNALVRLIDNPALQTELGAALFAVVIDRYAADKVIEKYFKWVKNN